MPVRSAERSRPEGRADGSRDGSGPVRSGYRGRAPGFSGCGGHSPGLSSNGVKPSKFAPAVTLIEAMVTIVVVAIAALGGLSYQYLAAKHAKIASAQITATRTVQLLLEDWKSTGGSTEYDPFTLGLGFSVAQTVPSKFSQGMGQGLGSPLHNAVHSIIVDDLPMVVVLKWTDVDYDKEAEIKLRQLAVIVEFGEVSTDGTEITRSAGWLRTIRPVILATYVRVDASGG